MTSIYIPHSSDVNQEEIFDNFQRFKVFLYSE
jgi:hypothetical protein